MEKVLEYYDPHSSSKIRLNVKLEDKYLLIKGKNFERVVFVDFISSMIFRKEDRLGNLIAGLIFLAIGLISIMIFQEINPKEFVIQLILILSVIFGISVGIGCLIGWWLTRCYTLEINIISDKIILNDKSKSLKELYDELVKIKCS